jgi:hypothetical protein
MNLIKPPGLKLRRLCPGSEQISCLSEHEQNLDPHGSQDKKGFFYCLLAFTALSSGSAG